ncbi:hypothetical protein [Veronia pacifica]|uniref:Uncharacterized protein n=1 Tax=Veronia pacifica TaxID=1080227 RepID=A0A1C3E9F6_9GAMM|nr:hypothetical protein [Veronia pacifica]ODA29907.1 hypothetical protein A8L45_21290 [Veronia pacifica]
MKTAIIPASYEEWRHCITVICGEELTLPYIEARIEALNSPKDYMTKKFVELYGDEQRHQTIAWFKQAKSEL